MTIINNNMKKILTISAIVWVMAGMLSYTTAAQTIKLPAPDKKVSMTLMDALQNRHSVREFSDKEISDATLSQILWAACGINRPDGRLTVPSAMNSQDILVYVIRKDGAYLYIPKDQALEKKLDKNLLGMFAGRDGSVPPMVLLLVSDHSKNKIGGDEATRMGLVDVGYVSQNICLVCTALGLCTVPRMGMDADALAKELGLDGTYEATVGGGPRRPGEQPAEAKKVTAKQYDVLINHPIGWPKE
jgi:SagB-type dehydrogenase family enzyme